MIFTPNSSFINAITCLFFPLCNDLSNSYFEVANLASASSAISF